MKRTIMICVWVLLGFFWNMGQGGQSEVVPAADAGPLALSQVRYWAYQIQDLDTAGAVDKIVNSQYDMVVLEPTVTYEYDFDAKGMVDRIKASKASDGVHRKLVLAYIDIGEAEEWRWYWAGHTTYEENGACKQSYINAIQNWAPWVAACDPDGWAGNYPVAYWEDDWKDIVINGTNLGSNQGLSFASMLEEVVEDGFDGIYLDWVEAWEMEAVANRARAEGKDPGQEMLTFIKEMRAYGKTYNPDFLVIQQNSSELINEVGASELKKAVDAIAQEGVWYDGYGGFDDWNDPEGYDSASCCTNYYLTRLRKYIAAGLPVFVCDYAVKYADDVYENAESEGFVAYASRRTLGRLTTTPPEFTVTNPPQISIDRSTFYYGARAGSAAQVTPQQAFLIQNSGAGTLSWTVSESLSWLSCSPTQGTGSGKVSVTVDASSLSAGSYSGSISIADANASNSPQTVTVHLTVYAAGGDGAPFGSFDTPASGANLSGSVAVTGWALDDVGVEQVRVYRLENNTRFYTGEALFVEGARTDIEGDYPTAPYNHRAGWGYMLLTHYLPNGGNGTYTLEAVAADGTGHETSLGTATVTVDNAGAAEPFGAIDTPAAGETVSGSSYRNWGWVLTPRPNSIPSSGSTIDVYIDNVKLNAHPAYGYTRPDIETLFPGYANSTGALGYIDFDTAQYENGWHTIAWTAVDSGSNAAGFGSRYFAVYNGGSSDAGKTSLYAPAVKAPLQLKTAGAGHTLSATPLKVKRGWGKHALSRSLFPRVNGDFFLELKPLERIEIKLGVEGIALDWRGYLDAGGTLRQLPIGATLDGKKGTFYWHAAPGYLGKYRLVFVSKNSNGEITTRTIVLSIR